MLKIIKKTPSRLDIELRGKINADEMRESLEALFEKSDGMKDAGMLYRITDIAMPTLGALGVEMTQLPQLFGLLGKFSKIAVVSDQGWVRNAAVFEGKLLPGLAIKSFAIDDEAGAERWLAET